MMFYAQKGEDNKGKMLMNVVEFESYWVDLKDSGCVREL